MEIMGGAPLQNRAAWSWVGGRGEKEAGSLARSSSGAAAFETEREQTEECGTFQLQDSWKGWIRCIAYVG